MKQTQLEMVKQQLKDYGEVSRNWALSRDCSRLGALIYILKKQGYNFDIYRRGGDYVYVLRNSEFDATAIKNPKTDNMATNGSKQLINEIRGLKNDYMTDLNNGKPPTWDTLREKVKLIKQQKFLNL